MKKISILFLLMITLFYACEQKESSIKPSSGGDWGEIQNASFEQVISSEVVDWIPTRGRDAATHFFSSEAVDGQKSLVMFAHQPNHGRWFTRVNVKPWSAYRFSGWIKTENLEPASGDGAGFNIAGLQADYKGFSGTNGWTEVVYEFETGDDDCFVMECLFNRGGSATGRVWFDDLQLELLNTEKIITAITVDVAAKKEAMPLYIYGQFIEHLGKCIYGGIWAEMLEDRKFFYVPGSNNSPWKVIGSEEDLSMDKNQSFVGEQTPVLQSDGGNSVALLQDGLGTLPDKEYIGRIVLKSSGNINEVKISLSWGDSNQEQTVFTVTGLSSFYQTFPISFKAKAFSHNASLKIQPSGMGKLWIGTLSLMPADNIDGFRADVLETLKELNAPVYRWPGGNFVSGYDWRDGIGNPDQRPPRKNPAWTGVEHNDVGIHEFMRFCELLNTEAYIAVNAGLGGAEEARKQVEYCIGDEYTEMGKWRAKNGHATAWTVNWWSIGNEMYGGWQLGHMSTEAFVKKHNEFADAMLSVNPDINLIAVGDPGPWDVMMLSNCSDHMDYISEHFYKQDWHGGGLMTHVKQIPDAIRERAEIHRKYREEISALEGKDIRICMDEWNYWYGPHIYGELGVRYFLRDALGIAAGINEFSKNSDIIYMANYAQTVNVIGAIKTNTTDVAFAATGQALKMYREYFGTIPVGITGETRPFDVAATLTEDGNTLVVSVVNPTWDARTFSLKLTEGQAGKEVEVITLTGSNDMAYNEPGEPEQVKIIGPKTEPFTGRLSIPRYSASIYRIVVE